MTNKHNGGAAFSRPASEYQEDCGDFKRHALSDPQDGMSLRDYFAAKAMVGLLGDSSDSMRLYEAVAVGAYLMADAMLKARGGASQ